jgi:TolA-binding protein
MKATQRHQLKQNELAVTAARVLDAYAAHRQRVHLVLVVVAALAMVVGGLMFVRGRKADRAAEQLGIALSLRDATIAPAPTIPGATQAPGTFPTEQARSEATLAAFQQVAAEFPSTDAGLAARYHIAGELVTLGRLAEAAQAYQDVIDRAGASLYGPMARLGLADTRARAGEHDQAIQTLTDLSTARDTAVPVDGVLMQLARVYLAAGRPDEARAAFRRVVDEFPQSIYAPDAQQQLAALN